MSTKKQRIQLGRMTVEAEEVRRGLRWAVGGPEGPRSSTWRMWGNKKGDFYLAARILGGILKTSLHRDRRCHTGFTSEYSRTPDSLADPTKSRHRDRWELPQASLVKVCQIVVPASELRCFAAKDASQMKWIPAPREGELFVASVFVQEPDAPGRDWPDVGAGLQPIGFIQTGLRSAWVVGATNAIDAATAKWIDEQRSRMAETVPVGRGEGIRGIFLGHNDDGVRWFLETAWQD